MGNALQEQITDWASGVVTTQEPDAIAPNASPRGWNGALVSAQGGKAAVQKRMGCSTTNASALSGVPAILGQYEFKLRSGASFTTYHILVSDDGSAYRLNTDNTTTSYSTPFTSGTHIPDFAIANNLLFVVNGQENKKFNGTTFQTFGILAPSTAPTITASASAGAHNGTYEPRVTFYNSATGAESSAGPTGATASPANKKIDWTNIPVSADSQVTDRRLYLRNTSTMSTFRLVATLSGNVATTTTTDIADAVLITPGPDVDENDQPNTLSHITFHRNRLFGVEAGDPSKLVYSKLGIMEAFDPDFYQYVNKDDGKAITALHSLPGGTLLIGKRDSMWELVGDDPTTWELKLISPTIGVSAHTAIATKDEQTFFMTEDGPYSLVNGAFNAIGKMLIAPTIGPDGIKISQIERACVAIDAPRDRALFALCEKAPEGEAGTTRNTFILPYNYRLQRWESDKWNPLDVCSFGVVEDANSIPWVYIGGYKGQVWKWWSGTNDGVPSGTSRGTITSATSSTMTCSTAAFVTTGAGLAQRYLYVRASDGTTFRRRIGSNSATVITLDSGLVFATVPAAGWTFTIGGPDFQWDTYASAYGMPFMKKRFRFLYVKGRADDANGNVTITTAVYSDLNDTPKKVTSFQILTGGAVFDEGIFDTDTFVDAEATNERIRMGFTGWAYRVRFMNYNPDEPFVLTGMGMAAETLTDQLA